MHPDLPAPMSGRRSEVVLPVQSNDDEDVSDGDATTERLERLEREMCEVAHLLDGWAANAVRADDGISVVLRDQRSVQIVLSLEQLDDLTVVGLASPQGVAADLIYRLTSLPKESRYLLFDQYVMVPSEGPTLPRRPTIAPGSGHWSVVDKHGRRRRYPQGPEDIDR